MHSALIRSALSLALVVGAVGCASSPAPSSGGSGQVSGAGAGGGTPPSAQKASTPQPASNPTAESTGAASGAGAAAGAADAAAAPGGGSAASAGGSGPGQTSDERLASIDKRFNDSLGSFDAELRRQQQELAKSRDARQAAAAGSATAATDAQKSGQKAGDSGSAASEASQGNSAKSGTGRSKQRDHSGDLKSEGAAKGPEDNAGNGATAREIPDGSDDDVVARRLRQAAEQETDPELKEKLWQEYLDYKKNAQGK